MKKEPDLGSFFYIAQNLSDEKNTLPNGFSSHFLRC